MRFVRLFSWMVILSSLFMHDVWVTSSDILTLQRGLSAKTSELDVSVALVSMVKNEGDILRQWLEYHSVLFGMSNIVVLDNFSSCNKTIEILKEYSQKGLNVVYEQGPYNEIGDISYQAVRKILPDHKLALPLDADEFLVAYTHGSPQANRALIWKQLSHLWSSGGPCYGFKQYYSSYPMTKNATLDTIRHFTRNTYQVRVAKKIFWLQDVPQSAFSFSGHQGGAHSSGQERLKCKSAQDRLGLLHFHLRSPLSSAQRALRDCIALKYLPSHATLETIQDFTRLLRLLVLQHKLHEQNNLIAFHRIEELLSYAEHGEGAFVFGASDHLEEVGTLPEIIDSIRST